MLPCRKFLIHGNCGSRQSIGEKNIMNTTEVAKADEHKNKETEIIINGRKIEVTEKELTYTQVVNLAFNNKPPTGANVVITVTYSKGDGGKQGSLLPGGSVKVKEGMVFD